jgi:hypothetical protein
MADDYALFCVVIASPGERYKLIFEPAGTGNTSPPAQYRPLGEIWVSRIPFIVLSGKSPGSPLSSSPGSFVRYGRRYRLCEEPRPARGRAGKHDCYTQGQISDRAVSPEPRNHPPAPVYPLDTFPTRKTILPDNSRLRYIVLPGNSYRPLREGISSAPGRYIVRSGNSYRPFRESITSCRGKFIVLPRKYTAVFPANVRLHVG